MRHRKITEHIVRALKPKPTRYAIAEDGLIVEVHPSGRRSFYAKYREHGKQHKEHLGEYPALSVKDAREKVLEIRHRLTVAQSPVKQSNLTLKEYIEGDFKRWAEGARRDSAGTLQRLKYHFITENPDIGATKLKNLTRQQFERWKVGAGISRKAGTVKRSFGDIRRALNLAKDWGYIRRSPVEGIKPPVVDDESEKLYLDDTEFERLTKAIETWEHRAHFGTKREQYLYPHWFVMFLRIALNTGARPGEVLKLEWKDVDLRNLVITFRGANTKNARTRRVPISDALVEHLKGFYGEEHADWDPAEATEVFLEDDGRVFPVASIRKPWARLQGMSKLPHVTPHVLRHHVASQLVLRGVALSVVRDLLGHRSLAVTSRYLSVRTSDKLEALNLL